MSAGLNCLIVDRQVIARIKQSMNNIANLMIQDNVANGKPNEVITAKNIYNKLKKAGLDIDLESVASLYEEAFATSINNYANFETTDSLKDYKIKTVPLKATAKEALIRSGFGKTQKDGKEILDWVKLMRKSPDEIKDEIKGFITEEMKGSSQADIDTEINNVFEALKGGWKQILSNAIIKAQNNLSKKNEKGRTVDQKTAVDKIADLYAEGLFDEYKDSYNVAMRKAVGINSDNLDAMKKLDELGRTANILVNTPVGARNTIGELLEAEANSIIEEIRYKEATTFFKTVKSLGTILDFVMLKILNNIFNRTQNFFSGKVGLTNSTLTYGSSPETIKSYADAVRRDVIRNNGEDFGGVNNAFTGSVSQVRKLVKKWASVFPVNSGFVNQRRASNILNQVVGVSSLNALDSYNKVMNTWTRFVAGAQLILESKGHSKKEAADLLHKELYGKEAWEGAFKKAKETVTKMNSKGANLDLSEESLHRFAADIIKVEIIEKGLLTADQLSATYEAAYEAAGQEMGHVPNNFVSAFLNKAKRESSDEIDKAVKNGDYNRAANFMLQDILINKIGTRFLGGGTNWVILKLEKGGLGIFRAAIDRRKYATSFKNKDRLSELSAAELKTALYEIQKTKDRFTRGTVGLLANSILLGVGVAIINAGSDDDEKRRKRLLTAWMSKHYIAQKAVDAVLPIFLSGYIAKMKQDNISWDKLENKYKTQPFVQFSMKLANQNQEFSFVNQVQAALAVTSPDPKKQREGYSKVGQMVGNYLDLNPLPTSIPANAIDIYNEIFGQYKAYKKPEYKDKTDAVIKGIFKYGFTGKVVNSLQTNQK